MTLLQSPKVTRGWPLYLLLLSLPAVVALFLYGFPINPDGPIHLLRIARLHEAIQQGILFPRWMPNQLLGYGYPSLNYYASASYYLVELLQLLGLPLYWAHVSAHSLLVFLAAIGMYLLARDLLGREYLWPPLVAAIAYSYGPYFLHTLYVRGAIAEQGAQMLLPWILWSYRRIWRSDRPHQHLLNGAIFLAALAFTHTISLLLFPPFLVGYIWALAWRADRRTARLRWTVLALGGAMAISAFYWLPLIAERGYLSPLAYSLSQQRFLPYSFLDAKNFLYTSLSYIYTKEMDYRLYIVQVIGLVAGFAFMLRRRQQGQWVEWLYWLFVALFCVLMMTRLTEPVWLSHEIFAIIQFPYRLLGLLQIPVALFTALPFCYIRARHVRAVAALLTISLLIWVYWPRLPWVQNMSPAASLFNMPMNAYFEASIKQIVGGGEIVTSLQEFRPRWVSTTLGLEAESVEPLPALPTVQPLAANPLHLRVQTSSAVAFPLRLNTFYFPGWQVTLAGGAPLAPYPSTSLGLLTAQIPAGEHVVEVKWVGTRLAFYAALFSQLALLLLLLWQLSQPGRRIWALALLPLLLVAIVARYWQPPLTPVQTTPNAGELPGLRFAGYGAPEVDKEGVTVYPYWYVLESEPPELTVRWQLQNEAGQIVAQTDATPFYDAYSAENWPAGTLIDDAQRISLPANLAAGSYYVVMAPLDEAGEPRFTLPLGTVTLAAPTVQPSPANPLDIYLGENIALKGYASHVVEHLADRLLGNRDFLPQAPDVAILHAGENLVYTLYWQLVHETDEPYSGFVHLTDHLGKPLAQRDQSPGPIFAPVSIWGLGRLYRDDYMLTIPAEAASGLYWPQVGMYNWEDVSRFEVRGANGESIGDHYLLPPVKIVNRRIQPAGIAAGARFGEMARLVRYDIHNQEGRDVTSSFVVKAGTVLTLTSFFQVENPAPPALTRFVQMRDAANRIAAQADSEPQNGHNPTWAWVKGEIVQDITQLPVPAETPPGDYFIYTGFYEPSGNYPRLPVTNRQGERLPNDELPLPLGAMPLLVRVVR